MKKALALSAVACLFVACGNPGGVDDEFYEEYERLGAPKILYQCQDQIGYLAGVGFNATFNKLVQDAERGCNQGEFRILARKE